MKIAIAKKKDLDSLIELRSEFYNRAAKIDKRVNQNWIKKNIPKGLKKELESKANRIIVCKDADNVVGYAAGAIESTYGFYKFRKTMSIYNIFIKKEFRSKGTGKLMILELLKWGKSKGAKEFHTNVWEWNKRAKKFYKNLGFKTEYIHVSRS